MGLHYKKSINLGRGVRITAGKKGLGVSAGVKGFRVSRGADGKTRVTASIPKTGLSFQKNLSNNIPTAPATKPAEKLVQTPVQQSAAKQRFGYREDRLIKVVKKVRLATGYENGELASDYYSSDSSYGKPYIITFFPGAMHLKWIDNSHHIHYYSIFDAVIKKVVRETSFLFIKKQFIFLSITLGNMEYRFDKVSEDEIEELITWHKEYKDRVDYFNKRNKEIDRSL
jgi:hypothetical protein